MFFKYLRLKNFKRTALAGLKNIELTFESPLQLILGTNGCGKTSIIRQAAPWVPETEHFRPGGEKEFHCVKNGVEYKLISVLNKNWVHQFWRDGENLNQGGTTSVQKELCNRYFGLTQDIYSILVGDVKFTQLSTAKRRDLFTYLSPTDLNYALGVYNRVKAALRDVQGVIKHLAARIGQETAKLVDDATAAQYAKEVEQLNEEIRVLLLNKDQRADGKDYQQELANTHQKLITLMQQLEKIELPAIHGFSSIDSLEGLTKALREQELLVASKVATKNQKSKEFIELSATLAEIKDKNLGSRAEIEARLKASVDQLKHMRTKTEFNLPEECRAAYLETEEFEKPLIDALTSLQGFLQNSDVDYTPEGQETTQKALDAAQLALHSTQRKLENIRHRLQHLLNAESVDCPSCNHRFVAGERPGERNRLQEAETKGVEVETKQQQEWEKLNTHRNSQKEFQEVLVSVRRYASTYKRCRGLFDELVERGLPYRTTQRTIGVIFEWKADLKQAFEYKEALKVKTQLEEALEQVKLREDSSGVLLSEKAQKLEREIYQLNEEIRVDQSLVQLMSKDIETIEEFNRIRTTVETKGLAKYQQDLELALVQLRNDLIDSALDSHYSRVGLLNNRIKQHDVAKALINDLSAQLEISKKQEVAYKHLMNELSPTDGLISEQISGFIASYVKSMNALISKVWTYPLKVFPCGIEKDELDYRFPIEVGDDHEPGGDVSNGSEAQKDFFDFVFVLVLALYIEPDGFPLYLDELGASFDEEHRNRVWQFVKDYVDAGKAPQAFMISHYAANHTAIANADLLVIDSSNVSVPRKSNQHAVLS